MPPPPSLETLLSTCTAAPSEPNSVELFGAGRFCANVDLNRLIGRIIHSLRQLPSLGKLALKCARLRPNFHTESPIKRRERR